MTCNQSLRYRLLVILAVFIFVALPALATTIQVPGNKPTIQAAIDAAADGDIVLVSDGTYTENIDFKGKAITVKSLNGPAVTIIDGGALDTVVKFSTQETSSSILNGFTVRNGALAQGSTFSGSGIYVASSSPTITNNVISNNIGCQGSGIDVQFGSPLIQHNTITNNSQGGCSGGTGGGGILIGGASKPQILNNTISNNSTGVDGGGISLFAAGTPTISGNVISGNMASGQGGGIAMANDSEAVVLNNVITGNTAYQGGGIAALVPSGTPGPTVVNNTLFSNSSANGGSEIYLNGFYSQTAFFNNIFIGAANQTAMFCDNGYTSDVPVFQYNDTYSPQGTPFTGSCTAENGNNGNISADPKFVNAPSDFNLQSTSPAIDAGSNAAPDLPEKDIAGNDRILDGSGHCSAKVDLGGYEFGHPSSLALNPVSISFPDQLVSSTSSVVSSTITNNASTTVTVCAVNVSGDFSQTNTCSSAIAAKGSCTVNVTFSPTIRGQLSGFLQVITSDGGNSQIIALSGKAVAPVFSPSTYWLNFSQQSQQVGTKSASQTMTLTNTGDGLLAITNVGTTGDFSQTNTCGASLTPAGTCTFTVVFAPTAAGDRSGFLNISDSAGGSPHQINLVGTANDFSLLASPSGATRATVAAGTTANYNLQVSPANGFNSAVALTCSGAPPEASCTVSPSSVTPNGSGASFTVSVTTTASAAVSSQASAPRWPLVGGSTAGLFLVSLMAILLYSFGGLESSRPRRIAAFPVALIMLLGMTWSTGCGGGSSSPKDPGTPKGIYTLTVTGSANGVSRPLSLTLTVN
jgi:parallel beta-helix repeat protein